MDEYDGPERFFKVPVVFFDYEDRIDNPFFRDRNGREFFLYLLARCRLFDREGEIIIHRKCMAERLKLTSNAINKILERLVKSRLIKFSRQDRFRFKIQIQDFERYK